MQQKRRYRRSVIIPLALFLYTTGTLAYLIPRNHEVSTIEKVVTVVVSYAIIVVLWFLLRHKEKLAKQREEEMNNNQNKKD